LLGLLGPNECVTAKALRRFKVDLAQLRPEILKNLASKSAGGELAGSGD
jgi:hypothetical protein